MLKSLSSLKKKSIAHLYIIVNHDHDTTEKKYLLSIILCLLFFAFFCNFTFNLNELD